MAKRHLLAFTTTSSLSSRALNRGWPERLGVGLASILAVIVGLQLAWWTWHFIVPIPLESAGAREDAPVDLAVAKTLFGEFADAGPVAPSSGIIAPTSNIRLKGVFAVNGKTLSAAVINLGGRDQVLRVDETTGEGIKLIEVTADRIVVSRNGVRETIQIDRAGKSGGATTSVSAPSANTPGFRLNVANTSNNGFSLSRNELNGVLQDPRQIEHLGRIGAGPNGGVRIDDARPGSLVEKLGLKAGDIIVSLNGQPVNGPGDLAKLYGQFSTLSHVRAEVRRNGTPMLLTYAINQ